MAAAGCGLPTVGPLAAGHMHTVVVWTLYDVERQLRQGGRCGVWPATAYATAVLVATHTVAVVEGRNDTWELDGSIGTILVGGRVLTSAVLPLVGAVEVDIELLTAMEKVPARETDLHLRTIATTSSSNGVGLNIEVVGLLKHAVQQEVKRVSILTGRTGIQ